MMTPTFSITMVVWPTPPRCASIVKISLVITVRGFCMKACLYSPSSAAPPKKIASPDAASTNVPTLQATHVNKPQRNSTASPRGFTLIELMAVVAIIAILALMAIPSYHDKYIREQVIEAMRLTDIAKGPVAAAWATTKTFPDDNAAAGLPVPDKVVSNYIKSLRSRPVPFTWCLATKPMARCVARP